MSELDLGASPTPAAPAPSGALVLTPPAPVVMVEKEQAVGAVGVDSAQQRELRSKAEAFVAELTALDMRSPAFAEKVIAISSMGDREMRASASVSNRMLDRPSAALRSGRGRGGEDVQSRVANTLAELRATVTDLDPARADLTSARRFLRLLPGADRLQRYFAKYQSAQSHLNAIIKALESGQDELRKDNASIETEKKNMWAMMTKLTEYNELATALDAAVEAKVAELEAAGKTEDANTLRSDALFPIRQRRQDIMTQTAVAVQGYMALDLVRKNNIELIKGVDRAQTTTVAALRTAVIVAQALARQKLVLDQVAALNTVTSDLIEATSSQLRMQGAQISQQAASSTIELGKLQAAFDNIFHTMDALDVFRSQATESMASTVKALEGQIERARPYLERTRRGESGTVGQLGS
ncbi:toxic anion resistance protein [Micromonospora sp. R77]|uniref:toxic anion resistance protein n=1 Tax=Micromonospora sp. R77 TaxID=2925836 RepID=UPI001F600573|nr:toxic anion resistance protein [Micromonospora sp. R77]MCI4066021.1 toxic anion resistance protein [Micromonospora sp. R77]